MNRFFLIGYMGCGKTTSGRYVASKTNLSFIDMDVFIEEKYHKSITQIFADMGQDKFREIERKALEDLASFENVIIATGGGAPCFFDNMKLMNNSGNTIYIRMSAEHLTRRLESVNGGGRPLIAGKKGPELLDFIQNGLSQREAFYMQATNIVTGTDEEIADVLLEKVNELIK